MATHEQPELLKLKSGVFARNEIEARLDLAADDPRGLVITPLFDRNEAIDADSVDLRLGTHFLLPRSLPEAYFSPDKSVAASLHIKVHVPLGRYLVVPAHQTVLGSTLEFIKLPCDASGEVLTKSSIARTFIVVETAPWIHPEYRGCLTLSIANVSNTPVLLYPGRPIGQLILLHIARDHDPNAKIGGTYFGPIHPEAPPFDNPETEPVETRHTTYCGNSQGNYRQGRELRAEIILGPSSSKPPKPGLRKIIEKRTRWM